MSVTLPLEPRAVPLIRMEVGVYRVTESRIPLERIVQSYKAGATPEGIVDDYDTLRLTDVYAIIGYYLDHREEVEQYLREQEEDGDKMQQIIEKAMPPRPGFREELLRRWAAMLKSREEAIAVPDEPIQVPRGTHELGEGR